MSEPRRLLLDPDSTAFELELLHAYRAEEPSAAARDRARALASVAAGATLAVGAIATAGAKGAAGSIAPKAIATTLLAKWLAAGAVVALATTGTIAYVRRGAAPVETVTAPRPAMAPVSAPASAEASPASSTTATATTAATPAPLTPGDLPVATPGPAVARPASSALGEQIAVLDSARLALEQGDPARALTRVDDYERRFRSGAFLEEAELVRFDALVKQGDDVGAKRVGKRFLAAHPSSPHAARVRAILAR